MARTPKISEDRREQIIEAALRVFAQKGFDRATNKDIADKAGITPGLIYHYFKSKEDLLRAAIADYPPRQLLRSLPPEMLELPPEELLRSLAYKILEIAEDEEGVRILRVYLPQVMHNPGMAVSDVTTIQELVQFLEKALVKKMASGELKRSNAALVAQLFVGSLMDLVLRRQIVRESSLLKYSQKQIVDSIVALTLQGLMPR